MPNKFTLRMLIILVLTGGLCLFFNPALAQEIETFQAESSIIHPIFEEEAMAPAPGLSREEAEDLMLRVLEKREQTTEQYEELDNDIYGSEGLPQGPVRETDISDDADFIEGDGEYPGNPATFVIWRNSRNTQANNPVRGSTLAEPVAIQTGNQVFAAGNFNHAEFSSHHGSTPFFNRGLPGGPAIAPNLCCDHDIVLDNASRVTFHSALYINNSASNGVVRIFVRQKVNSVSYNCSYDIQPTANSLPDYPHIGLTKKYLYLTTNNIPQVGTGFAEIRRFNLDDMANCTTASLQYYRRDYSVNQRVWVPSEGTNNLERMYWGQLDDASNFRIYWWPDSSNTVSSTTRAVSPGNYTDGDCRGGVNNVDWIQRSTSYSIAGFRMRCAVAPGENEGSGVLACYWNSNAVGSISQFHIRSAVFNLATLNVLTQPHVWNSSFCYGYPAVSSNGSGDIGMSLARGGRAGGDGEALNGRVALADEYTGTIGFVQSTYQVAAGTHNPSRHGDYFTVRRFVPCDKYFAATNFALLGGTALANVNSRYVVFGRNASYRCVNQYGVKFPWDP